MLLYGLRDVALPYGDIHEFYDLRFAPFATGRPLTFVLYRACVSAASLGDTVRYLPLLLNTATLLCLGIFLWRLVVRAAGTFAGATALLLFATSPFNLALGYGFATHQLHALACCLFACWALLAGKGLPARWSVALGMAAASLFSYTVYPLIAAFWLLLLFAREYRSHLPLLTVCLLAVHSPVLLMPEWREARLADYAANLALGPRYTSTLSFSYFPLLASMSEGAVRSGACLFAAIAGLPLCRRRSCLILCILLPLLTVWAMHFAGASKLSRTYCWVLPFWYAAAGFGITFLARSGRGGRLLAVLVLGTAIAAGMQQQQTFWRIFHTAPLVARDFNTRGISEVICLGNSDFMPVPYGVRHRNVQYFELEGIPPETPMLLNRYSGVMLYRTMEEHLRLARLYNWLPALATYPGVCELPLFVTHNEASFHFWLRHPEIAAAPGPVKLTTVGVVRHALATVPWTASGENDLYRDERVQVD